MGRGDVGCCTLTCTDCEKPFYFVVGAKDHSVKGAKIPSLCKDCRAQASPRNPRRSKRGGSSSPDEERRSLATTAVALATRSSHEGVSLCDVEWEWRSVFAHTVKNGRCWRDEALERLDELRTRADAEIERLTHHAPEAAAVVDRFRAVEKACVSMDERAVAELMASSRGPNDLAVPGAPEALAAIVLFVATGEELRTVLGMEGFGNTWKSARSAAVALSGGPGSKGGFIVACRELDVARLTDDQLFKARTLVEYWRVSQPAQGQPAYVGDDPLDKVHACAVNSLVRVTRAILEAHEALDARRADFEELTRLRLLRKNLVAKEAPAQAPAVWPTITTPPSTLSPKAAREAQRRKKKARSTALNGAIVDAKADPDDAVVYRDRRLEIDRDQKLIDEGKLLRFIRRVQIQVGDHYNQKLASDTLDIEAIEDAAADRDDDHHHDDDDVRSPRDTDTDLALPPRGPAPLAIEESPNRRRVLRTTAADAPKQQQPTPPRQRPTTARRTAPRPS